MMIDGWVIGDGWLFDWWWWWWMDDGLMMMCDRWMMDGWWIMGDWCVMDGWWVIDVWWMDDRRWMMNDGWMLMGANIFTLSNVVVWYLLSFNEDTPETPEWLHEGIWTHCQESTLKETQVWQLTQLVLYHKLNLAFFSVSFPACVALMKPVVYSFSLLLFTCCVLA